MDYDDQVTSIRKDLQQMADLLATHNFRLSELTRSLMSENNTELWNFLTSNSLWGGAGSIADQALLESPDSRRELEQILIRIGKAQQGLEKVNARTDMWVSFFEGRL